MVVLLDGEINQLKQFNHPLAEQVMRVREEAIKLFEETLKTNNLLV